MTSWREVKKDIAEALGYKNLSEALKYHVDEDDKLNDKTALSLGQRGGWLINESGLYSLILSSKLPNAKIFKRWVTSEVLPSIRQHGAYMTDVTLEKVTQDPDFLIGLLQKLKLEQEKSKGFEEQIEKKVDSCSTVVNCDKKICKNSFFIR